MLERSTSWLSGQILIYDPTCAPLASISALDLRGKRHPQNFHYLWFSRTSGGSVDHTHYDTLAQLAPWHCFGRTSFRHCQKREHIMYFMQNPRGISFQSGAGVAELEHQALGKTREVDGIRIRHKVKSLTVCNNLTGDTKINMVPVAQLNKASSVAEPFDQSEWIQLQLQLRISKVPKSST